MPHAACLACLVSNVSGCHKNALGKASTSCRHTTKLKQSTFLRYLWFEHPSNTVKIMRCFEQGKQLLKHQKFLLHRDIWWSKLLSIFYSCSFYKNYLKLDIYGMHWCLICAVPITAIKK